MGSERKESRTTARFLFLEDRSELPLIKMNMTVKGTDFYGENGEIRNLVLECLKL